MPIVYHKNLFLATLTHRLKPVGLRPPYFNSDLALRNITEGNFAPNDTINYVIAYRFGSMVIVTFTVKAGLSGWVETVLTSTLTPIADVTCTRGRSAGVNDNNLNMQATLKADGKIYFHFEAATAYAQSFSAAYFTTKK